MNVCQKHLTKVHLIKTCWALKTSIFLKSAVSGSQWCILRNSVPEEPDATALGLLSSCVHRVLMFCKQDKAPNIICFLRTFILQSSAQCNTIGSMQRMPSEFYSCYILGDGWKFGSTLGKAQLQNLFSNPQSSA